MNWERVRRDVRWLTVGLLIGAAIVLLMGCSTPASAAEWVNISVNKRTGEKWDARVGTFQITRNDAGEPIALLVIRSVTVSGDSRYEKNYVRLTDCAAGYGQLVALTLNGRLMYSNQFVDGGIDIASGIAETICALAQRPTGPTY